MKNERSTDHVGKALKQVYVCNVADVTEKPVAVKLFGRNVMR